MALFGNTSLTSVEEENFDLQEAVESFLIDDVMRMSSKQIKEFCESEQCAALVERAVLKKPTVMRLSKEDDEKRRIKLICYQLARDNHDPNWDKCVKYRALWKSYRAKIFDKWGNKATRLAMVAQREYIKKARTEKETPEQRKVQAAKQDQ